MVERQHGLRIEFVVDQLRLRQLPQAQDRSGRVKQNPILKSHREVGVIDTVEELGPALFTLPTQVTWLLRSAILQALE